MKKNINNILHKDNKNLILLFLLLFFSLIISAIIFYFIGQENLLKISYGRLEKYTILKLFLEILKRNIIYFIVVLFLTCLGFSKTIYVMFCLVSILFGISIIYFTKIVSADKIYFILNLSDYLLYFPILFYFTNISILVSKYIKKSKKIETKSKKIDIMVVGYLKMSAIILVLISAYSFIYSYYIHLII